VNRRHVSVWLLLAALVAYGCSGGPKDGKEAAEKDYLDRINARLNAPPPAIPPAPKASEFKLYKSPNGLFQAKFPGEPKILDFGPSIPDHMLEDKMYRVEIKPRAYAVRHRSYESPPDPAEQIKKQMELQWGLLEDKVVESKDVTFKNRPAKDVVFNDDDKARRAKVIIDGKDTYEVSVDVPVSEVNAEDAKAFIESFELLKD
jgi:hypothetical protein